MTNFDKTSSPERACPDRHRIGGFIAAVVMTAATAACISSAVAQSAADPWTTDVEVKKSQQGATPNTTVIQREGDPTAQPNISLVALLTADGQQIDQGLVWRIYEGPASRDGKARLINESRDATPTIKLTPGDYTINAAFGRANITRHITVKPDAPATEKFVLNAGGLRVNALINDKPAPSGAVTYKILSDDRDQFNNRTAVMNNAKPGLVMRLNAGIYHIVSTYGDANARVEADVTVEAGKLTEATVTHAAGRATFRLVTREGGEALPDTHWTIVAPGGEVIKESVGALPMHTLAPGSYAVKAKWSGVTYARTFDVSDGQTTTVEVMKDQSGAEGADTIIVPEPSTGPDSDLSIGFEPATELKSP